MQTQQRPGSERRPPSGGRRSLPEQHVPPVPTKRVLGKTVVPWLWGYGVFQGSVGSVDSLVLFYMAVGLGLSPAAVGIVDAAGSVSLALGALLLTFLLARIPNQRLVFVLSMGGTGLVTAGFALAGSAPSALLLSLLFGLSMVAPTVLAPVLASSHAPAAHRSLAFSRVNRASASGSAAGIGLAALWVEAVGDPNSPAMAMRLLFFVLGLLAVLGAGLSYRYLKGHDSFVRTLPVKEASSAAGPSRSILAPRELHGRTLPAKALAWRRLGARPMLSDELVFFLALSFVLFAGTGMSFSGVHAYLVTSLKAPIGLAMGAMFGFKVATYYGAGRFPKGRARMVPGQLLGLTGISRAAAIVLISVASLLPTGMALPFALLIVTLWGVASGILAVIGAEVAARLAVPGRWMEAMAFYAAWTHAGAIVGTWAGGVITTRFGFAPMFLISAALIGLASLRMMRM